MKDNSLDGHRGKVALSDTPGSAVNLKCDLKATSDGSAATNFDDDYNEWELGIGDLIIDLDADIEKTNNGSDPSRQPDHPTSFSFLGAMSNAKSSPRLSAAGGAAAAAGAPGGNFEHQATVDKGLKMKIKRKSVGSKYSEAKHEIVQSDTKAGAGEAAPGAPTTNSGSAANSPANGPETTPNNSNNRPSKHSSGKGRTGGHRDKKEKNRDKDKNSGARNSTSTSNCGSAPVTSQSSEMNGSVLGVMSPLKIAGSGVGGLSNSPAPPPLCSNSSPLPSLSSGISSNCAAGSCSVPFSLASSPTSTLDSSVVPVSTAVSSSLLNLTLPAVASSSSPPMPNLTLKIEPKFASSPASQPPCAGAAPATTKPEEDPSSPPQKRIKLESPEVNGELDGPSSPNPEMKDASTCASVGTITEPDCLGPCEPGTSVMLEGIVWQETDGGVLVVNVTWRGKTYVGTLLDCTKHDWAPPRFCESPTSDVDAKNTKGRGKRGRGGNAGAGDLAFDARNCVQSKLRNGKGRRTTVNSASAATGFTVPSSPAKSDGNGKRKARPQDLELPSPSDGSSGKASKRNRKQERGGTPTSTPATSGAEFSQPSSPVLIVCPEPNCGKKYKHINGLRYHQSHAHSAGSDSSGGGKMDDTDNSKDVTNSSDNEESMQESASVSACPATTFANSVPPPSSSPSLNGLPPENDSSSTGLLSTLASGAVGDSKEPPPKVVSPGTHQDLPADGDGGLNVSNPSPSSAPSPLLPVAAAASSPSPVGLPAVAVSAVTTSVIQSSNSVDSGSPSISQAVTVSIPTSHVVFNQGIPGPSCTTVCSVSATNSAPLSPRSAGGPASVTTTFAQVSSIVNAAAATSPLPLVDKTKTKQDRPPDKYKPKSDLPAPAIRPVVQASGPLLGVGPAVPPPLPGMDLAAPLKPIQPRPVVLGEPPSAVNPALADSLKKEKSKHKKKSKDKERERKMSSLPLTPTKLGMVPGSEECEAVELTTSYPSLEAVSGSTGPLPGAGLPPMVPQQKPESSVDMSLADDSINENMPSPAYSDISDANDTAPVLESEVAAVKEKEDKVDKAIPDAAQSPAANINAYGMYTPYYSQPPYLIPSVSPQSSSVSGSQAPSVVGEKSSESAKKEIDRIKENRPWSNPSGESRDSSGSRQSQPPDHPHESEKKPVVVVREESAPPNPGPISSPANSHGPPVQDYSLPPQHYPYSYGYVQGYPYAIEPSSYHMHMVENDPHYKQQYKQYLEEQQRLYKEQQQQHHHHQQQMQHHHQQQQQQHHQQQQQHHGHHSQHQSSHHQSKSQHHPMIKEERDRERERSREGKERGMDKMQSGGLIMEYSSKIQHSSSVSGAGGKDHEMREMDTRPPSLPAQTRMVDPSAPSLKEKRDENHQILKENIELKSQMEDSKNKINQYEMAMIYERHREDMRRFYMYQDKMIEQQQQRMEPGIHHHTHLHQTVQTTHGHMQTSSSAYASSSSSSALKQSHKDELSSHSKSNHFGDSSARSSSVVSPAKSDHVPKPARPSSTSSPKGVARDAPLDRSKEYLGSSGRESSSKKDIGKDRSESSGSSREEKKPEKPKAEPKPEPEGQKPTMETTGPPPPPTNSYAYLHPSYLQGPPHFPHMPFEPAAHAMYRGGINPMIVSAPHYGGSPYVHPQIRYVAPELSAHPQPPPEALAGKLHPAGPPKALDLLHHVSQQYTTTHKIHELQEHALMSPTPTSTPASSTPSSAGAGRDSGSGKSSAESSAAMSSKVDASRDASRSPPTQRHIHQHHHTHVGVGYPIYDPYGVSAQKSYT